jgi:hypothetical protein
MTVRETDLKEQRIMTRAGNMTDVGLTGSTAAKSGDAS